MPDKLSDHLTVEWAPSSLPTAASPTWVDITDQVHRIRVEIGRDDDLDVYVAGRMTLLVNNGDTLPGGAHPTIFDLDTFHRRRQIRITAAGFHGWINDVKHDLSHAPAKALATVTADDFLAILAEAELTGDWSDYTPFAADGEFQFEHTIGDRDDEVGIVNRAGLDPAAADGFLTALQARLAAALPVAFTKVGAAKMPLWIPTKQTGNMLQILQQYLDAECAFIAAIGADDVLYAGRWYPFYKASTDPGDLDAVLSDDPGVGEFGYLKRDVRWSEVSTTYANSVTCKSVDGEPITAEDIPTGFPRDSLTPARDNMPVIDDNWIQATAEHLLAIRKQTNSYPRSIRTTTWAVGIDPSTRPGSTARVGDFHKVSVTMPGGTQTDYLVLVERIVHEMDHQHWYTTFEYTSADRWIAAYPDGFTNGLFIIGTSTIGDGSILAP